MIFVLCFLKFIWMLYIIYFSLTVRFWCSFLYFQSIKSTQWNSSLNWIEIQTITGGFLSQISENKKKSNGHESQKIKKNPNHDSRKLKFVIFENFTNHSSSAVWRQRKLWLPQSQIMKKKWWKRDKKCMRGSEKGSVIKHALK